MQGSFASSSTSLPAGGEKKAKRNLFKRVTLRPKPSLSVSTSAFASPAAEYSPRRASEMTARDASRQTIDIGRSVPATPKSARSTRSFDAKSLALATRVTTESASRSKRFSVKSDAPPVPYIPKSYLISDEIFVIANLPPVAEVVAPTPRISESSSAPSSYSMMSSTSSRSSSSWLDDLQNVGFPSPPSGDNATFSPMYVRSGPEAKYEPTRSSLDDIDDQIVLNLCLNLCDDTTPTGLAPTDMERDTTSTRSHRRTSSLASVPLESLSRSLHTRTASAPLSLGPLPPQPTQAPAEAVLRKTNAIKKRYSRQLPSPKLPSQTNSPALGSGKEDDASCYFGAARAAPSTHRLDSISSLKTIEADLSHDSKMVKRNHQRSYSKHSITSEQDFLGVPRHVELTPGRGAARKTAADFESEVEQHNLRSRWSEDSEDGSGGVEEVRRLFSSLLSPKLGSAPKMTSSLSSYYTIAEGDSAVSGTKTPDMISVRHSSSSSSSNSSISDFSDLTVAAPSSSKVKAVEDEQETLFDFSRASLDYRAIYALAQQYAASNSTSPAPSRNPSLRRASTLKVKQSGSHKLSSLLPNASASRSLRSLAVDPLDRTYHLRK
ncbi:hypothetical protein PHSY_000921 [Pseudozyma hubeiensis SY62]|uniref:Uncharacterized protein n=1 Tax=Pseudozyma hubeiensis (strain SY62) TaxID=1305764 RepID=R9NXP5_PSEHS|nr:hypothetical protein PHSY_000921 [Pseudozyma hubeiensis SY62]GAC93356.1 hypothetical protein PHSY_000921 [Pseudozyma hubeiensis SY62]